MTAQDCQEALYYEKKSGDRVQCRLCPRFCLIGEGKSGLCRVRVNKKGALFSANYARVTSSGLDPVEKKPLYHFYPGRYILSLGSLGCNLHCGFCQNWQIAHRDTSFDTIAPGEAVQLAKQAADSPYRNIGLAYTYSEPLVWYEYILETAKLAREAGLKNVLVTNGYINHEPLKELLPFIDAMNIDVKGFTDEYYAKTCAGHLEPVLKTVESAVKYCRVELTTLLVTGLNDSPREIGRLVDWVAALDPGIPLHFSRYFPNFECDLPPTPLATMRQAYATAREKLRYVYLGNMAESGPNTTFCPSCGRELVRRSGYQTELVGIEGGMCAGCHRKVDMAGVG